MLNNDYFGYFATDDFDDEPTRYSTRDYSHNFKVAVDNYHEHHGIDAPPMNVQHHNKVGLRNRR